jgi:hypothetical protein
VSCPHTHQQNGSAERKHRHIVETGLSLLAHASMPLTFWDEAFVAATYLINRLPSKVIHDSTPLERLFDQKLDYSFLRVFGCACWPHLRPYNSHKLQFRSKQCVFFGYSSMHRGYKCLKVSNGRVYMSRDVTFDEEVFPFSELNPNAGAQLRSDVALFHPTFFRHDCGDITIHDHITDNPLNTNNILEVTGEILRENGEQIGVVQEENRALQLQPSQTVCASPTTLVHGETSPATRPSCANMPKQDSAAFERDSAGASCQPTTATTSNASHARTVLPPQDARIPVPGNTEATVCCHKMQDPLH